MPELLFSPNTFGRLNTRGEKEEDDNDGDDGDDDDNAGIEIVHTGASAIALKRPKMRGETGSQLEEIRRALVCECE